MVDRQERVLLIFEERGLDDIIRKVREAKAARDELLAATSGASTSAAAGGAATGLGGFASAAPGGFAATGAAAASPGAAASFAQLDLRNAVQSTVAQEVGNIRQMAAQAFQAAAGGVPIGNVAGPSAFVAAQAAVGAGPTQMMAAGGRARTIRDVDDIFQQLASGVTELTPSVYSTLWGQARDLAAAGGLRVGGAASRRQQALLNPPPADAEFGIGNLGLGLGRSNFVQEIALRRAAQAGAAGGGGGQPPMLGGPSLPIEPDDFGPPRVGTSTAVIPLGSGQTRTESTFRRFSDSTAMTGAPGGARSWTDPIGQGRRRPIGDQWEEGPQPGWASGPAFERASRPGRGAGRQRAENITDDEMARAFDAAQAAGRTRGNQVDHETIHEFVRADRAARGADPFSGAGEAAAAGAGGRGGRGGGGGFFGSRPQFLGGFGQRVGEASMAAFPFAMAGMTFRFGGMPLTAANQAFAAADLATTFDPQQVEAQQRLFAAQAAAGRQQAGVRNQMTNIQAGMIEGINQIPGGPQAMAVGGAALETGANVMDMIGNAALISTLAFGMAPGGLVGAAGRGIGAAAGGIGGMFRGMFGGGGGAAAGGASGPVFRAAGVGAGGVINMVAGAGMGMGAVAGGVLAGGVLAANTIQTGSPFTSDANPLNNGLADETRAAVDRIVARRGGPQAMIGPPVAGSQAEGGFIGPAVVGDMTDIGRIRMRQMAEAVRAGPQGDPATFAAEQEAMQRAQIAAGFAQQRLGLSIQERQIGMSRSQMLRGQAFERDQITVGEQNALQDVDTGVARRQRDLITQVGRASRNIGIQSGRALREIGISEGQAQEDVGIGLAETEEDIEIGTRRTRRDILLSPALTGQAGALIRAGMARRDALEDARRRAGRARGAIGRQAGRARGGVGRQEGDARADVQTGAEDATEDIETGARDARTDIRTGADRQRAAVDAAQSLQREMFEEQAKLAQQIISIQRAQIAEGEKHNADLTATHTTQIERIKGMTKAITDATVEMENLTPRMRQAATDLIRSALD